MDEIDGAFAAERAFLARCDDPRAVLDRMAQYREDRRVAAARGITKARLRAEDLVEIAENRVVELKARELRRAWDEELRSVRNRDASFPHDRLATPPGRESPQPRALPMSEVGASRMSAARSAHPDLEKRATRAVAQSGACARPPDRLERGSEVQADRARFGNFPAAESGAGVVLGRVPHPRFTGIDLTNYRMSRGLTVSAAAARLAVERDELLAAEARPDAELQDAIHVAFRVVRERDALIDALLPPEAPPSASDRSGADAPVLTGADLRAWRKTEGINQSQAASRLGVSQGYVAKAEGAAKRPLGPALRAGLLRSGGHPIPGIPSE